MNSSSALRVAGRGARRRPRSQSSASTPAEARPGPPSSASGSASTRSRSAANRSHVAGVAELGRDPQRREHRARRRSRTGCRARPTPAAVRPGRPGARRPSTRSSPGSRRRCMHTVTPFQSLVDAGRHRASDPAAGSTGRTPRPVAVMAQRRDEIARAELPSRRRPPSATHALVAVEAEVGDRGRGLRVAPVLEVAPGRDVGRRARPVGAERDAVRDRRAGRRPAARPRCGRSSRRSSRRAASAIRNDEKYGSSWSCSPLPPWPWVSRSVGHAGRAPRRRCAPARARAGRGPCRGARAARPCAIVDRPDLLVADRDAVLVDAVLDAPQPRRAGSRAARARRRPAASRYCVCSVPPAGAAVEALDDLRLVRAAGRSSWRTASRSAPTTHSVSHIGDQPGAASSAARWRGGERLAGRALDERVPAQRRDPGAKNSSTSSAPAAGRSTIPPARVAQRRLELRRDELPVQVVLVVDGREREVDLRGPVGRVATVGPREQLEALDEVPPAARVVGVGIGVQPALEVRHHEHPAGEGEQRRAAGDRRAAGRARRGRRRSTPATAPQPLDVAHEPAEEHRDALGGERVHACAAATAGRGRPACRRARGRTRAASSRPSTRTGRCC